MNGSFKNLIRKINGEETIFDLEEELKNLK